MNQNRQKCNPRLFQAPRLIHFAVFSNQPSPHIYSGPRSKLLKNSIASLHLLYQEWKLQHISRESCGVLQPWLLIDHSTAKNTVISPNFLVWKFCGKAQFPHSFGRISRKSKLHHCKKKTFFVKDSLTLFRVGLFRIAHGWAGLPKICHTYPTMMKLGAVLPYLKKIQKIYESRDKPLEFCWHQHFFTGNQHISLY